MSTPTFHALNDLPYPTEMAEEAEFQNATSSAELLATPLVIHAGRSRVLVGMAAEALPSLEFETLVGRPRHLALWWEFAGQKDSNVGAEAAGRWEMSRITRCTTSRNRCTISTDEESGKTNANYSLDAAIRREK